MRLSACAIILFPGLFFNIAFADFSSTAPSTQPTATPATQPDSVDVSQIHYVVQFTAPTIYMPIGDVEVTFFDEPAQSQIVAILQKELTKQVGKEDPTTDVTTTAWLHHPGTNANEDETTGDHDGFPIYVFALKKIMPFADAEKTGKLQK